ncbi:ATP synthase gamma chain [invertebrate metagenome]|uniref:ATP synthase gamma chain n=1 Tax=invertebrate metagenome TaxID=1711999 RepID=A0A484H5K6_9ZZZZ
MPSLKDFRQRIASVKSTKKITSAMKMVAASKLRRAQEAATAARPYAERMERILGNLTASIAHQGSAPLLMTGNGRDNLHLIIPLTANRGLCGAFNSTVVRETRRLIADLVGSGKHANILCIGRKGCDQLKKDHEKLILNTVEDIQVSFGGADAIGRRIVALFDSGTFDVCTIVFNRFQSAISQVVTRQQLIPFPVAYQPVDEQSIMASGARALYEYEPSEEEILASIAPRNVTVQIFRALLESVASEHGARMTAMDNATRNANDMINDLTIAYNRTRQAYITKELIEIISGAEAL